MTVEELKEKLKDMPDKAVILFMPLKCELRYQAPSGGVDYTFGSVIVCLRRKPKAK